MKAQLLLDVIGEARDAYLQEIDRRVARVRHRRRWRRGGLIAASVILIIGMVLQLGLVFNNGIGARCGGSAVGGIAAGGYCYYEIPGDGFFRYSPQEGSLRLTKGSLIDRWFDKRYSFTANDYGFYYTKGDDIYRIRHGETASEKLYHYDEKVTTPYMYPAGATDIAVDVHYEGRNVGLHNELFIIDGITGERKTTIMNDNSIGQEEIDALRKVLRKEDPGSPAYDEASDRLNTRPIDFAKSVTYTVGGRTLELVLEEGNDWFDYAYRLTEDGEPLTDGYVEPYNVRTAGDSLVFIIGRDGDIYGEDMLIVHPDGTQQIVRVGTVGDGTTGDESYCFTYDYAFEDDEDFWVISAVRISDGEQFELGRFARGEWFSSVDSDGKYLWLIFRTHISCYAVVYENGVPTDLTLIDSDITADN